MTISRKGGGSAHSGGCAEGSKEADAYRGLFLHNPQPMWVYDLETLAFLDVNDAAVKQYGYSRAEFLSMAIPDIRPPEEVPALLDNVAQVTEGLDRAGVWWHRRKDGTVFEVEITSHTLEFKGRQAELVTAQDVHQHLAALRALRDSEAKYRLLVENQTDLVVKVDLEGRFLFVSPSYCTMFDKSEEELLGRAFMPLVHEDDREPTAMAMESLFRDPFSCYLEQRAMTRHGWRWLAWVDTSVRDESGAVLEIIGVGRDITDKKIVEEQLRASEARYRAVVEDQTEFIVRCTPDGVRTFANEAYCRYFGLSTEEAVGSSFFLLIPEEEHPAIRHKIASLSPGNPILTEEHPVLLPDGTRAWNHWTDRGIFDGDGRLVELQSIGRDVTERKRAEEALRKSEGRFRTLVERSSDAIFLIDAAGRFVDVNRAACKGLGHTREELLKLSVQEVDVAFDPNGNLPVVLGNLPPDQVATLDGKHRRRDGSTFPVEIRVAPFESGERMLYLATVRDVTERRRAEEERRQLEAKVQHAQKLESLGVLAGGIAHDFNNLLMGILGNADLAMLELTAESAGRDYVKRIEIAAQRAAELTNQMLAYSGKGRFLVEPINLNRLLEEMDHLLHTVVSKKAGLRYHLAEDLPSVEADASQLRQVVMNLIVNASDALGEESGSVTISSGVVHVDQAYMSGAYLDEPLPEGEYVYLEVSDTGCGMDAETRDRIFDPFFTSKFAGRGLGLAAVLGIVRGHQGAIKVYSEVGRGSTFKILLPCSEREPARQHQASPLSDTGATTGTVMVVDDDPTVCQVAQEMLKMAGHEVLTAEDGLEAVELFAARPEAIDVVVLDMTMPRMDGAEAFQELRRIRPEIRVILSSGYNEQDATNQFAGKGLAGFIQKPYRAAELVAKVRETLDGR